MNIVIKQTKTEGWILNWTDLEGDPRTEVFDDFEALSRYVEGYLL